MKFKVRKNFCTRHSNIPHVLRHLYKFKVISNCYWPGNAPHLRRMVDLGVPGFKCFLIHSGVDEFPAVTEQQVTRAALIG